MSSQQQHPDKPLTPPHAWQPFTPRGVAAFATGTLTRLILVQTVVALIVAAAMILFLRVAWFPVIAEAVQRLPDTGAIHNGELVYGGESSRRLAENARLAIVVDANNAATAGHVADIEVTFQKHRVVFCGALGCLGKPYDRQHTISFNRPEVEPAWGAWRLPILALTALVTVVSLLAMWWCVALVYLPLVKLIAFFADRIVTWRGAWRLSAAALLPGALIVAIGIVLYGFGALDLIRLALFYALHMVASFVFIVTSPFFLPKVFHATAAKNPFAHSAQSNPETAAAPSPNPFSRGEGG